jgi:integrase
MHVRNLLSKILSTAVEWDYLLANPVRGVKLPAQPLREDRRFLTVDEVTRLLKALDGPAYTLVLSAVLTGMRIGELLALRWKNVDFQRKVIRVREAVYEGHVSTPKTRSGLRDVPIGPALEHALREHIARSRIADDSLVFPTRNRTYQRPGNLQKRHLLPACAEAGLRGFSWHDFRHYARDVTKRYGRTAQDGTGPARSRKSQHHRGNLRARNAEFAESCCRAA